MYSFSKKIAFTSALLVVAWVEQTEAIKLQRGGLSWMLGFGFRTPAMERAKMEQMAAWRSMSGADIRVDASRVDAARAREQVEASRAVQNEVLRDLTADIASEALNDHQTDESKYLQSLELSADAWRADAVHLDSRAPMTSGSFIVHSPAEIDLGEPDEECFVAADGSPISQQQVMGSAYKRNTGRSSKLHLRGHLTPPEEPRALDANSDGHSACSSDDKSITVEQVKLFLEEKYANKLRGSKIDDATVRAVHRVQRRACCGTDVAVKKHELDAVKRRMTKILDSPSETGSTRGPAA